MECCRRQRSKLSAKGNFELEESDMLGFDDVVNFPVSNKQTSGSGLKAKTRKHVSAYFRHPYVCTKTSFNFFLNNMKLLNTM